MIVADIGAESVIVIALIVAVVMAVLVAYFAISISRNGPSRNGYSQLWGSLFLAAVSLGVAAVVGGLLANVN